VGAGVGAGAGVGVGVVEDVVGLGVCVAIFLRSHILMMSCVPYGDVLVALIFDFGFWIGGGGKDNI
jgi:hypothetical protein